MNPDAKRTIDFHYHFKFSETDERDFTIKLDYTTLTLGYDPEAPRPEWTRLGHNQCGNCPLVQSETPQCPIARNLVPFIDAFKNLESIQEVEVTVTTQTRSFSATTSLQAGLGAIFGIIMVTSGCPVMNKLRPLVDTHLPFMNLEESVYRITSMYITAQYFRQKNGLEPDWELNGLDTILQEINLVNQGFCERLRSIRIKDAAINALVSLNANSNFTTLAHKSDWINRMQDIFLTESGFG